MEIVVEFFLHLVAMERILVVFLRIQRKSTKRITIERCDPLFTDLWRKPQTNGFHDFFLLFSILLLIDRSTVTDGRCKDNTSKRPVFAM